MKRTTGSYLARQLRESGVRLTPQRSLVLEAIESGKHVTAEQILARVHGKFPYINLSTVYRTLDLLKQKRLITETDLGGGSVRYELMQKEPHHHLICQGCGEVREIDDRYLTGLRDAIESEFGYVTDIDHMAIWGWCPKCRKRP